MPAPLRALVLLLSASASAADAPLRIGTLEDVALATPTNQVIREAYRRIGIGIEVEFQPLPLRRSALLLKEGKLAGDFIRTQPFFDANPEIIKVGVPLRHLAYWVWKRPPCERSIDFRTLAQGQVAYQLGAIVIESQLPAAARVPVAQTWDVLGMARQGRTTYAVMPMTPGMLEAARTDFPNLCHVHLPLLSLDMFHALAPDQAALRPKLEQALLSMQRDGFTAGVWAAAEPRLARWAADGRPKADAAESRAATKP